MENIIKELQNELRTRFFMDGENHPKISAVKVYRFTDERIEMPQTDNPYLYIVLDGMLRLYTPSGIMDYMAGQYSVSKIDTPLSGTVLAFSEQQDFLAISIEFFHSDVIQTILELDNELTERIMSEQLSEQEMTLSDSEVLQSVSRLFFCNEPPNRSLRIYPKEYHAGNYLLCPLRLLWKAVYSKYCRYRTGRENLSGEQLDQEKFS